LIARSLIRMAAGRRYALPRDRQFAAIVDAVERLIDRRPDRGQWHDLVVAL